MSARRGFSALGREQAALDERSASPIGPCTTFDGRVATRMADIGIAPHIIEQILNHQSGHRAGVAGIYNRSSYEREVRTALALWADHVRTSGRGRRAQGDSAARKCGMTMPRGGARKGTGHPPAVPSEPLRLNIGSLCERLWQQIADDVVELRLDNQTKKEREIWDRLRAIPLKQRRTKPARDAVEDAAGDLDFLIRRRRHLGPHVHDVPRGMTVKRTRPWGVKAAVIAYVIKQVAEQCKVEKTGEPLVLSRVPSAPPLGRIQAQ